MLASFHAILVAFALCSAPADRAPAASPSAQNSFASIDAARRALHEATLHSVVSVTSYVKVSEEERRTGRWQAADESPHAGYARHLASSGIVIDAEGTVICCRSPLTVENGFADLIDVETADGVRLDVELIGSEPTINLAVLKLKPAAGQNLSELVPARIGNVDELEAGDTAFAIGDPPGSARTFAPGVVMAVPTAACYQADLTGSFIHASMAIAPEAVGGALINGSGEVVGMLVPPPSLDPKERTQPLTYTTFAMQIQTALGVGEALGKKRTMESPWLGFSVLAQAELKAKLHDDAKFDALAKPAFGLYIEDLYEPSPAAAAGVRRGDFIVDINGGAISSVLDFQQALYYYSGASVPMRFVRDGRELQLFIKIERRPSEANRK